MDAMLKGLVAATCFVVIATAGYFVVRDVDAQPSSAERLLAAHQKNITNFDRAYGLD